MIQKIRDWLYNKFLPYETREQYQHEVESLRKAVISLKQQNRELKAYIEGVNDVIKSRAKIEIKNEVVK